jgi:hypothetical protein
VSRRTRRLAFWAPRLLVAGLLAAVLAAPAPGATPTTAQRHIPAIILAWSQLLNADDNAGIAKLYEIPAMIVQGQYAYRLTTRKQVALWYSLLPCSGTIVSVSVHGRYATAVFRLGNRGSKRCDAPGSLAAARFEIVGGKIVSWVQVPVPTQSAVTGPIA